MLFPERPITHEHIRQFCGKFNEGIRVEYKRGLDQSVRNALPKILSSFANSHGGALVVGINAQNGVPQPPFDGFAEIPREELPLTIENICLQNLHPPILPKSTVVRSDTPGNIFLIVEVEESGEAPHATENSTRVYVRTGNAANPYELAKVDLIIDLVKRRSVPLERANRLLAYATERGGHVVQENTTYIQVSVCPTYPRSPFCSSEEVWDFASGAEALRENFVSPNWRRRIPDGVASSENAQAAANQRQYREVNRFGLIFARDQFARVPWGTGPNQQWILSFDSLFRTLTRTLTCARRFYTTKGYAGPAVVQTTLQNVRNETMIFLPPDLFPDLSDFQCVTGLVSSNQLTSAEEMNDRWREVLYRVALEVCWSFWQRFEAFPAEQLRRYLEASAGRLP